MSTTKSNLPLSSSSEAAALDAPDLREQVKVLGHDIQELARLTKDALGHKVETAKDAGVAAVERGREKAVEYRDHVADLTRESPFKSLLIAAGVGAVLGLILGRR